MSQLQRSVAIAPEVKKLLESLGYQLPDNIKEIQTPTEYSPDTNKIVLPTGMDKLVAAKELEAQWKNEETKNNFVAGFEGWNWQDVLVAIRRVTEREFGWMNGQASFWEGDPTEIDIVVDLKNGERQNEKAFYGSFNITGWESAAAGIGISREGVVNININAKRKYSNAITAYYNLIREQLEKHSIYRGKNVVVSRDRFGLDFEIIENKPSDKVILNHAERTVVDTFVLGSLGEPGKRCFLFTGGYGTGKTETAMRVGKVAVEKHGMSFFYLKDADSFDELLNQCKKYQPCVLFVEDIDEIASGEARDSKMNKILNTLDGVQTKGNDLTVIFTTNHPSKINSAARRPGRIDIMVKFENCTHNTKVEIYKAYFSSLPGGDILDYKALADKTPSVQGAVIAEIAKRSVKLCNKSGVITEEYVIAAINSMAYQIELMNGSAEKPSKADQMAKLLGELITGNVWDSEKGDQVVKYCN